MLQWSHDLSAMDTFDMDGLQHNRLPTALQWSHDLFSHGYDPSKLALPAHLR